jgi:hypothetical protein
VQPFRVDGAARLWVQARWGDASDTLGLPPLSRRALRALARLLGAHVAWLHAGRLPAVVRAELEALRVLATWRLGRGDYLTLTPWAREQLGVVLVEEGPACRPYWAPAGSEESIKYIDIRIIKLKRSELVPVRHKSVLEYLCDLETGETTTDEAQAVKLWGRPLIRTKVGAKTPPNGKVRARPRRVG